MKIHDNSAALKRDIDSGKEGNFSIKASAKAFKILSDSLYTDKVSAIIRELSCNALDSHIMAGKGDVPFYANLPSVLNPTFIVRDYGVGLSEEDVMVLYTTYFESTKTNSDDFVGALGLGSKSPFSYTDSFLVTSYFDGMKKTYSAFISEDGTPHIMKMGETKSDEPNGMKIEVPVKTYDYTNFTNKAENVYKYFDVKPDGLPKNVYENIKSVEYKYKTDDFGIRRGGQGAWAIQGPVAYPIELNDITSHNLTYLSIDLFFNIGELDIAASREALSNTERTKLAISKKIEKIRKEVYETTKKDIDSCKCYWDAVNLANSLKTCDPYNRIFPKTSSLSYKGVALNNTLKLDIDKDDLYIDKIYIYDTYIKRPRAFTSTTFAPSINIEENYDVYILDSNYTLKEIESIGTKNKAVVVCKRDNKQKLSDFYKNVKNKDVVDHISKFFAGKSIKFISDLNIVVKEKAPRLKVESFDVYSFHNAGSFRSSYDYKNGGYYFLFENGEPTDLDAIAFKRNISEYKEIGIDLSKIYGIPKKYHAKVKADSNWSPAADYLKKEIEDNVKTKMSYSQYVSCKDSLLLHSGYNLKSIISRLIASSSSIDDEIFVKNITAVYKNINNAVSKETTALIKIVDDSKIYEFKYDKEKNTFTDYIENSYPLLYSINCSTLTHVTMKSLIEYLNLKYKENTRITK